MYRAAPLQHAAAGYRPHGQAGIWLVVVLLISSLWLECNAKKPLKLLLGTDQVLKNVTLPVQNVCLKSIVRQKQIDYYNIDVSGELVPIEDARASKDGTFVDFIDAQSKEYSGHLSIPLRQNASQPWIAGFYSSCGPLLYHLKAWCSVGKDCNLTCSAPERGPCVSFGNCRCTQGSEGYCDLVVEDLPGKKDVITRNGFFHLSDTVKSGTWMYFRFQTTSNASRSLVELDRAYGDVILFVKPQDNESDDPLMESLPIERDALNYADLPSYQNRLSHHYLFVNGSGKFYIGVYNSDTCVEEDSIFNLTVTISTPNDPVNLCPLNCSYPQGHCVKDNVCSCEVGYGGTYCASLLWQAAALQAYSGQLLPGEWAYINMTINQVSDDRNVSVYFSSTGHSILLAQQSRYPTLKDFYFKFTNSTLDATPSGTYEVSGDSLRGGLILAVFNIDYKHRGVSEFEIVLLGTRKGLGIWIIILAALGSSIILLTIIAAVRHFLQMRGQIVAELGRMDFEATAQDTETSEKRVQDRVLISTLPLIAYQQGMLPKEDSGCSICLSSYSIEEIVCRLPGCNHIFHIRCLENWFQTDDSCPLCRVPVSNSSPESEIRP
ncbi:uncharacterized protein [Physcomitrium patens]|uniref:RING-type domain-containing protein n=1 Tax=Physcomitrium patens TaxID=3218 RepID=A0A2K1J298_PHYPA|nr:uncharacterized protein LOC112294736 isoform X2 [Physcomitrium patens]PNR35652.1 hypothetical protein PHYPA_021502 [Physcomitrium patens]|eukprot:XP_024401275.1 uncharacterized protein LOC112294736 isoform X2 [Physcomitrella patens]